MRDRIDAFGDTEIVGITFAGPEALAEHRRHLDLPFPLLADPDRVVYRRFQLGRGARRDIWNFGTVKLYVRLLRRGRRLRRPTQDIRQLGGDFVVDDRGRLAAAFWPPSPDARPDVATLISSVTEARHP